MKKILLASSILAGTAGLASAEITLSGDARMGILNGFQLVAGGRDETGFTSRARVTFTMTGSSDSGLEFGASFRADNAGGAASGTAGSVYVSGAFGKLSMGDVDGAAAAAVGHVDGVGLTGLGDLNEIIFTANGGADISIQDTAFTGVSSSGDPSALYEYSTGSLSIYASITQPSHTFVAGAETFESKAYSLAAAYSMDAYKFSIGYEKVEGNRIVPAAPARTFDTESWVIGADATFGAVTVKARYGKGGTDFSGVGFQDHEQWALSATYTMDALSVTGFASHKQFTNAVTGANKVEHDAMGLGASYDLGGGASVKGGVAKLEQTLGAAPSTSDTTFDLGLSFSF